METEVLRRVATAAKFSENYIIHFEAGEGSISDDLSIDCFIFCASYANDIPSIDALRDGPFVEKDRYFFITDEATFERRCAEHILQEVKKTRPNEKMYVYCFTGKVNYLDAPKETEMRYDEVVTGKALPANLAYFFEKPALYAEECEYRFVWICTNKPLEEDYQIYSINGGYFDAETDPQACFSRTPIIYTHSPKSVDIWDLNK